MNGEKLKEVIEILSRYNNESLVDYYELFGFNKNSSLEELKNQIRKKRLQILFHPDQIHFIPQEYHEKYLKMIELVKDVVNTFDSHQNKENYDQQLKQSKSYSSNNYSNYDNYSNYNKNNNYNNYDRNNNYNNYTNNNNFYDDDKTEDLDEVAFQQAIIQTAEKHGFQFATRAVYEYINHGRTVGFSRNGPRETVSNLDLSKMKRVVAKSSINDDLSQLSALGQAANYITDLIYNTPHLRQKIDAIQQACADTIMKYDMKGGHGQTRAALNNFCNTGDPGMFTNANNGRTNLRNKMTPEQAVLDAKCFLLYSLNRQRHNNPNFSFDSMYNGRVDIVQVYTDELIRKANVYKNGYDDGSYSR